MPLHGDTDGARGSGKVRGSLKDSPNQHHRRSIRLCDYDYTQAGAYFVTICAYKHSCIFGKAANGEVVWSRFGRIAAERWSDIPRHFAHVTLDAFVVMPNHIHGILFLRYPDGEDWATRRGIACYAPTTTPAEMGPRRFGTLQSGSVAAIIRSYKSAASRSINELRRRRGARVWQRNYYEHIIRDERTLEDIREYIANNPLIWAFDHENPDAPNCVLPRKGAV